MSKKLLLINGHIDMESFNFALFNAYKKDSNRTNVDL